MSNFSHLAWNHLLILIGTNTTFQERLLNGSGTSATVPRVTSNTIMNMLPVADVPLPSGVSRTECATLSPSPGLAHLHLSKQLTTEDKTNAVRAIDSCKVTKVEEARPHQAKASTNKFANNEASSKSKNLEACRSNGEKPIEVNLEGGANNAKQPQKPTNPFAKKTNSQENTKRPQKPINLFARPEKADKRC